MFTIHITEQRFWGITQAANLFERERGMPSSLLPLPYEHEPNIEVGDEVEIIVGGKRRYAGRVNEIRRPNANIEPSPPPVPAISLEAAERAGISKEQVMKNAADFAANLKASWYIVVDADPQQIPRPV